MTREDLITAYWEGEVGDVELADVGISLGMEAHEIAHLMEAVRQVDGVE